MAASLTSSLFTTPPHGPAHAVTTTTGSLEDAPSADTDDCFSIELDVNQRPCAEDAQVTAVLELLTSGSPESQLEGFLIAEHNITQADQWLTSFIRSDGVGLCVELMGCFSPAEVQRAAANVCTQIAASSPRACEVLLGSDVGSMIEQHIKRQDTTLQMFEDASNVVAAIAGHPHLTAKAFERRKLMPHFVGVLTDTAPAAAPARCAALSAINALCTSWPAARIEFFSCGGASTVLHTLLQTEREPQETKAAVELLLAVAAAGEECREIMSENGVMGIEVLVQVHRDAEARGDSTLSTVAAQTIAVLTHRHTLNMATLENRTKLLGDEGLVYQVLALHAQIFTETPISPTIAKGTPIPTSLSTVSTSASGDIGPDGALHSPIPSRKHSLDSSRALYRMSSSVKSMLGSMRKFMRNDSIRSERSSQDRQLVHRHSMSSHRSPNSCLAGASVTTLQDLSVV